MCGIIGIASDKPVSGNIVEALKKCTPKNNENAADR